MIMEYYLFAILLSTAYIGCMGQQTLDISTGKLYTDLTCATEPTKTVEPSDSCVEVSYEFKYVDFQNDDKNEKAYHLSIRGFATETEEGNPSVPIISDLIRVPFGYRAYFEIISSEYSDFNYQVAPCIPPTLGSGETSDKAYTLREYHGFFPENFAERENDMSYRDVTMVPIRISPVLYDPDTHIIRICKKLKYRVKFSHVASTKNKILSNSPELSVMPVINGSVLNPLNMNDTGDSAISKDITQDMVIIASDDRAEEAERFADFKRLMGYRVGLHIKSWWSPDTTDSVVKAAYHNTRNLRYLVTFGNNWGVPGRWCSDFTHPTNPDEKLYTDVYYAIMQPITDKYIDCVPDIHRGRIFANDKKAANIMVSNIINYELLAKMDSSAYHRAVHTSIFEPQKKDSTKENWRFIRTSEDILNYTQDHGVKVSRVYGMYKNCNPQKYSNNSEIPTYLRLPEFKWDGKAEDINNLISEGCLYVLNSQHGDPWGWGKCEDGSHFYDISDVKDFPFTNCYSQPLLLCCCCSNGYFGLPFGLLHEFMGRQTDGGAIAAIAASNVSYTPENDWLFSGIIDAIWPKPGFALDGKSFNSAGGCTTLGEFLDAGIVRLRQHCSGKYFSHQVRVYHCYGDPSMYFRTSNPKKEVINTYQNNEYLIIQSRTADAITSFYNHATGESVRIMGKEAKYKCSDPSKVSMVVTGPGIKPYFKLYHEGDIIIQDSVFTESFNKSYPGESVAIGSNLDILKSYGKVVFTNGTNNKVSAKEIILGKGTVIEKDAVVEFNIL